MPKIEAEYDVLSITPATGYRAVWWEFPEGWPEVREKPVLQSQPVVLWAVVRYQGHRGEPATTVTGMTADPDDANGLDTLEYLDQVLGYQRELDDLEAFREQAEFRFAQALKNPRGTEL